VRDLESWSQRYPTSDLSQYRSALLAREYYQSRQYEKAIDAAEPLIRIGLEHLFSGNGAGAELRLQVLAATALSIGHLGAP
jgi:hypothetical protein